MPFRYLRDPLFLFCFVAYFVNRLILKPMIHHGVVGVFLHSSFNDLVCLPFWLPIMVWCMRKMGLRRTDAPPDGLEVIVPLILWSWWFEVALPGITYFRHLVVGDPYDILWYTVGALGAIVTWRVYYRERDLGMPSAYKSGPPRNGG